MVDTVYTSQLELANLASGQAGAESAYNESLWWLDALVQLAVLERLDTPPGSPADGDRYLVIATATGDWTGHENDIALYLNGAWYFKTPREGWTARVEDEDARYEFDGSGWAYEVPTSALTGEVTTAAGSVAAHVAVLRNKRYAQLLKDPGAATATVIGLPAPTLDGSSVANSDDSNGPLVAHLTGTVSGNTAGLVSADFTRFRRDWLPDLSIAAVTGPTITSIRYWIGMFSANPDAVSDLNAIHGAAFRYDTGVDGTAFWRCVTGNNGGSETSTTTTVAITSSTRYLLRIEAGASNVNFYIDGVLVATHTTTLPTATQLMGYAARCTTLTGASRRILWSRMSLLHN